MRKFASFSFSCPVDAGNQEERKRAVLEAVDAWLLQKGAPAEGGRFPTRFGEAELVKGSITSTLGEVWDIALEEPTHDGRFRTELGFAFGANKLSVHGVLSGGSDSMAPTFIDARCPFVLRSILKLPFGWSYRGWPLSGRPLVLRGEAGGAELERLVWSPQRTVPVIVVSEEYNGALLHPGLPAQLADELASLAIVVHIDGKGSWYLTQAKGKEWSCYNGAIRLFWPGELSDPMRHPLWSAYRLMEDASSVEHASTRIRNQLRRMIFSQSALAVWEPRLFSEVRQAARDERVREELKHARSAGEFEQLAEQYAKEASDLRRENKRLERELAELKGQLEQLNLALRHQQLGTDAVAPDDRFEPATVEDAVLLAMDKHGDALLFGADVDLGVKGLKHDACPPLKLFDYLSALAEMTRAMNTGSLGKSDWLWLKDRGVDGSDEEKLTRMNRNHQKARTWDDGSGSKRYFDKHLKPNEATRPDRCVRVYFEYEKSLKKTIVGWVGRHPD